MLNTITSCASMRRFALVCLLAAFAPAATILAGSVENPGTEGDGSFVIGPDYHVDPDLTDLGRSKGKYFEFTMRLAESKVFRGDDKTLEPAKKPVRAERKIFVYVPAAYKDGTRSPLLVKYPGYHLDHR